MATNITLTDAETVPVNRVFEPSRVAADFVQYEHRSNEIYIGYDKITYQVVRPTGPLVEGQNRNLKLHMKLETPMLKTVSTGGTSAGYTAGPAVDYRLVAEIKFTMPEQCTKQDRKNLRSMLDDWLGESDSLLFIHDYDIPT